MKSCYRNILLASAVIVAAAGCSKTRTEDVLKQTQISINPVDANATKAMLDQSTFSTDGNRMIIYDYNQSGLYFKDHIGPDVQNNNYGYATVWPFENAPHSWTLDTHKFFGWLAKDANYDNAETTGVVEGMTPQDFFGNNFSFDEATQILTIPEMSMNQNTDQFDFLYSNIIVRDMVNAPNYDPVQLQFGHLFTAVSFGVENTSNTAATIHEFRIENILNKRSATIDFNGTEPVISYTDAEEGQYFSRSRTTELTVDAGDHFNNIFNHTAGQEWMMLWPLSSDHIHSTLVPDLTANPVVYPDDYRIYIKYSAGESINVERRINFPETDLEAGHRYYFNIKFSDKRVELTAQVQPWEYVENEIDFNNETINVTSTLRLSNFVELIDESGESGKKAFFRPDMSPISGQFTVGTPVGGTWMVSLVGDIDAFEIYPDSGIIDGKSASFDIRPKIDNPAREYSANLRFAVRKPDGTIISASEVILDNDGDGDYSDDEYTIILSAN